MCEVVIGEKEEEIMVKTSRTAKKPFKTILIAICVLLTSIVFLALVQAWGPARETFTMGEPSDFVTFNSITDNPSIGDERNFVRIREAGVGTFGNEVDLILGREYEVYIFFHNNASASLNPIGTGIAQNTRVRSMLPDVVRAGERQRIGGEISASNATPERVWDHVYIANPSDLDLVPRFVLGSAIIHSNGEIDGRVLSRNLFGEIGTFVGYNQLDGLLPGGAEFSGHIIYRFVVEDLMGSGRESESSDIDTQKEADAQEVTDGELDWVSGRNVVVWIAGVIIAPILVIVVSAAIKKKLRIREND